MLIMDDRAVTGAWIAQADNLQDLVYWLRTTPKVWAKNSSHNNAASHSWDLGCGYDGALKLADSGWHHGVETLHQMTAKKAANLSVAKWTHDVVGDLPDIPRYIAGDPLCMIRHGHPKGKRPIITIAINVRTAALVTAQQMVNFGAAMCQLVERLEMSGRRVELIGYVRTNKHGRTKTHWAISWHIKRPEDKLDLAAVAFGLAHPAMWRRLIFAAMERSPKDMEDSFYGIEAGTAITDFININPNALVIEGINTAGGSCSTPEMALAFAVNKINLAAGEELVTLEA